MKKYLLIALAILLVFFTGCGDKEEVAELTEEEKQIEVVEKGLQIIDVDKGVRNIAVMINNHNEARPNHSGLQEAHTIYEIVVEGGISRMMAIFNDKDIEQIGSVRSARPYYLDYALENDAIYVHFGWSTEAEADIKTLGINNINGLYDSGYDRITDLSNSPATEHTAFTSTEGILTNIENKNYRYTTTTDTLLNYVLDEVDLSTREDSMVADSISIPYSSYVTSSYKYDEANNYYLRFTNLGAHTDVVTGLQYHFKNIIVVNIKNTGSYTQTLDNVGTGTGYYITNGYAIPITYSKSARAAQTIYKDLDGNEIEVNDGNTFIQIQPIDKVTTIK